MGAALALVFTVPLATVHLESGDHCGLDDPEHQCDICRALAANPALATVLPDLPAPHAVAVVDTPATPAAHCAESHLPQGRAPPVPVHVT